ncbi:MAG: tRNA 2-selenouridine(34) synthase MnmH [Zoogloeaceae bacterium]|jgi:tRNA 2-selenouridine synthase|nr:tRNA 2-selenouridine(34) synthase MnmH [Zoogloeaceae bacterium]
MSVFARDFQVPLTEIGAFDALIDVRSPAEYAEDHIPGAINLPVLDDDERREVGTLYAQNPFAARKLGAALVAQNLSTMLGQLQDKPKHWRPLVYCWRGGMRSQSAAVWFGLIGWRAGQLIDGWRAWRRHVLAVLAEAPARFDWRVICGPTGSAKTRLLAALAGQGAQILDLEGLAAHKGSVLGALPGVPQPTQKWFESRLTQALGTLDPGQPVFVEAESRKIGQLFMPEALVATLREAPCLEICATRQARIAYLLADYAYLGDDPERLCAALARLKELVGNETLARWQGWARAGDLPSLYAELIERHYDPRYARSQGAHFAKLPDARKLPTDDLSEKGIEDLARLVLEN